MRTTMRIAGMACALAIAAGLGAGCGSNPPAEDPVYEDREVAHERIEPVSPPYGGKRIVVVPFVNKSLSTYPELGNAAPDVLSAMAREAGFRVLEGKGGQLDAVMEELSYGQSEFVDPATAVKIGKHLGAELVLVGSVTDYREVKTRGKSEFDFLGLVEIGSGANTFIQEMAVSSRIVDVETREILGADAMTSKKQKYEVEGGKFRILGIGTRDSQTVDTAADTLGVLLRLCFATSLNKVVGQMNRLPPPPEPGR